MTSAREGEGERGREGDSLETCFSPSPTPPLSHSSAHSIRLRGPWDYLPLARAELLAGGSIRSDDRDLPAGGTIAMPADWSAALGNDFRGLVRFTRRFAQPTGLSETSRVFLVIDNVDWQAAVTLNGQLLGHIQLANTSPALCLSISATPRPSLSPFPPLPHTPALPCPARFDIKSLLAPRNELTIDVVLPAVEAGASPFDRQEREGQSGGLIGLVRLEIEDL